MRHAVIILTAATGLLSGCETLDKTLNTAERAIGVVQSPSAQALASVAHSKDPKAAAQEALKKRGQQYKENPQALIQDVRQAQRDYQNLMNLLTGNVSRTWGKGEVRLPDRTHYVKYTQNYQSRTIVDFDAGSITVETVDDKDPRASLKNAIVTTLLTPDDPRAVDLFSDKGITLTSDKEPYLYRLVVDHRGKPIGDPAAAEGFAGHLLDGQAASREVEVGGGRKNALYVKIGMVPNFENEQARKYRDAVEKSAAHYRISPSLVYAIIRTESNFNPFAVSSAPAYGLMQLVPTSGGREAYRRAKGEDGVPSKEYLFDAEKNIELGTAYLSVLSYNQLEAIGNTVSREYCVISAYNTGPGNVLRTFDQNRAEAVNRINRLEPPAVYEKLRTGLPYEETRHYIQKVVQYRKQFVTKAAN
jgi:membrane-bound lytic murein transglycosylase C